MKTTSHYQRHAWPLATLFILIAGIASGESQLTADPGAEALKEGNYKSAESYYRGILAQSPNLPEALSNLGIALQMQGKSSEAINAFERALRQKQMPRTYALLAEEKCKTRDLEGARPMIARIVREYFKDASILAVIAPCLPELDDPIQSVKVYEALLSHHAFSTDLALIQLAKSYRKSAQFFFQKLSQAPDSAMYISTIRDARDKASMNARGAFETAAKSSPNFRPDLGFSAAVARWRKHPQDAALLYLLSVLSSEQSIRQIEICDDTYPDSPYLAQQKAEILADRGHEDEAVSLYEGLIQTHPELPGLLYDLGMLFRKERQWDKALNTFQRQLTTHPDDEQTAARASEALFESGRWKELSEFLSPELEASNPPLWALLDFADAMLNMDEPDRAMKVLATAERLYPSDRVVHYKLSRLYRHKGNLAQAEKELKLFRELSK